MVALRSQGNWMPPSMGFFRQEFWSGLPLLALEPSKTSVAGVQGLA